MQCVAGQPNLKGDVMLIELTMKSTKRNFLVNPAHIMTVWPNGEGSEVVMTDTSKVSGDKVRHEVTQGIGVIAMRCRGLEQE